MTQNQDHTLQNLLSNPTTLLQQLRVASSGGRVLALGARCRGFKSLVALSFCPFVFFCFMGGYDSSGSQGGRGPNTRHHPPHGQKRNPNMQDQPSLFTSNSHHPSLSSSSNTPTHIQTHHQHHKPTKRMSRTRFERARVAPLQP